MANRRQLTKRRKAVRNIRKITRTMQLIATARFQAAFNRAVAARPYTEKLAELVRDLSGPNVLHPLMQANEKATRSAVVVLTSMRGLCGGYNANVLRKTVEHIDGLKRNGVETDVHMVGKKGVNYFRFLRRAMSEQTTSLGDAPRFDQVEPIANDLMARFERGEIASAYVVYMRFLSASKQRPHVLRLLPLSREETVEEKPSSSSAPQYEFSPDPESLLNELLPATVRVRLFQCFNDAVVSEQIGRMVAMKAATDAAADMITALTRKYNRARQTQITMELLDIVGGANALA